MKGEIPGEIPAELMPLYTGKTAHDVIRNVRLLVRESYPQKQMELLDDEAFLAIVAQALGGVDECYEQHRTEILEAFTEENRELAERRLGI